MALQKIRFQPGIVREISQYSNSGGWYDCDKVRFRAGYPETIGGWTQIETSGVPGVPRNLHQWSLLNGQITVGIGSHLKYYLLNSDTFYDITPQRTPISLGANPFTTVTDVTKLQVTITAHNCLVGDYIVFSGATTTCGNYTAAQLNSTFTVYQVVNNNTLILNGNIANAGTSGVSGGGSAVVATPDINTGLQDAVILGGYGIGTFGSGAFGTPRTSNQNLSPYINQPRIWYADNFGQNLLLNPAGQPIYYWQASSDTLSGRAKNLATVSGTDGYCPTLANGVWVSPISQAVVAMGCTPLGSGTVDPMQIRWSDLGSAGGPLVWNPLRTNSAGGQRLASGSYIVGWLITFSETLIWTDTTLYSMTYTGTTFVFSINVLADGVSMISPRSAVTAGSTVFWMDTNAFMQYNGAVSELPCSLKNFVFTNINRLQQWKCFAGLNHNFSEVWWFYPSLNSTEVDSYVIFNYQTGLWSKGTLNRTAWLDPGRLPTPIATDPSGLLYFHESGTDANGQPMTSFIESADIDIDGGDAYAFISKIIPDVTFTGTNANNEQMTVAILGRSTSGQKKVTMRQLTVNPGTRNLFTRARNRRLSVRFGSSQLGTGWRLGTTEIDLTPDGKR